MSQSFKLLSHLDQLSGIKTGDYRPPVMVDIDPVDGSCNLDCAWCCQAASRESRPSRFMPDSTMERLGSFSKSWGIRSWRIAGDSEPLLNRNISILLESGRSNAIPMGLITNGVFLNRLDKDDLKKLNWLGVSLDAATAATWSSLKRETPDKFDQILENIKNARALAPELDISIKFLRWSSAENLIKSDFVVNEFAPTFKHASDENEVFSNENEVDLFSKLADELSIRAIIKNAYPKDFPSHYAFESCRATALGGVFDASHNFHLCCDARGVYVLTDDYTRDDWNELPSLWGGDQHQELISSIQPKQCIGCAKYKINEVIEKYIVNEHSDNTFI
ncbi:radical SAM protein [Synechococcus sp. CBW1107]|jgi:organic radical activating enzyme|uniref:radical SAM protein n=1 Tax=Synechococcus sp. CBW1107 TaxID=2789857 RepID=UPI002AD2A72D|nr:radical SAM protein [Synechococcus sp. CBW1107]